MSPTAGGGAAFTHPCCDVTFEVAEQISQGTAEHYRPDLRLTKGVDKADAAPGDTLNYSLLTQNIGTGDAKDVQLTDRLPDGSTSSPSPGLVKAGAMDIRPLTYVVPCATTDGTVLINNASVTGKNLLNNPEVNTSNNASSASTTVHAPKLTLAKTATSPALAGEAIRYGLTYQNTGTGGGSSTVITDTLPADVYYSGGLDLGAGPAPTTVTRNLDGTTTLTWNVGTVAAGSGSHTIEYTARTSLLTLPGSAVANSARLTYSNANACTYAPVLATGTATITSVPPTRDPLSHGYWKNHSGEWTSEILARIQATDQRFDGIDGSAPDGRLSASEVSTTLGPGGGQPKVLLFQLLATYFDLATRRIGPNTVIKSKLATKLGLGNVRDAARYAIATLGLPPNANKERYSDVTGVLDEIVNNQSEVYGPK